MARRVAEERELYNDGVVVELPNPSPYATREEWLAELAQDPEAQPGIEFDAAAVIREMRGPLPD